MLKTLLSLSSCLLHILHIFHSFSHPCPVPRSVLCICLTESVIRNLCTCQKIPWHQQYGTQALGRRKTHASLFLGTNNEAAHPSMAECKLWLVLRHSGCYRCSFLHLVIDFVFNKERELKRTRPNTAVLMLINMGNRDKRKIPETFRGNKNWKERKTDVSTPTLLFSAHCAFCALASKMIVSREKAPSLKWKFLLSWQLSLLSEIVRSQHSGIACKS